MDSLITAAARALAAGDPPGALKRVGLRADAPAPATRRLRTQAEPAALGRARRAAHHAGIPALTAEVDSAYLVLDTPAARLIRNGGERVLRLDEVEALLASNAFVVDACRHVVRRAGTV